MLHLKKLTGVSLDSEKSLGLLLHSKISLYYEQIIEEIL